MKIPYLGSSISFNIDEYLKTPLVSKQSPVFLPSCPKLLFTPALTYPAHHLKIHLIIHWLGADTPTKERYSSAVSGGEERPLGCVEEGTDGK